MGAHDQFKEMLGEDFFDRRSDRTPLNSWHGLCVCGHLDRYHSPSVGGLYKLPDPTVRRIGGDEVTTTTVFHGCVGALRPRGFVENETTADRKAKTIVEKINVTCPCEKLRPVARVDRPNRFFNQRLPLDRSDAGRHPFLIGIRAFSTHLSKRKAALEDPTWATAEFDRRFTWIEETRVCAISSCRETDVLPRFVNDRDLSELRCPAHQ